MAWRWLNATIMFFCIVLILALQGLPAPVTSSGWRVAETRQISLESPESTSSSFATAEPTVNTSFIAPSTRTAADPVVDLHTAPVRAAGPYVVQTPWNRPAADPYVVLGVATAPRNTGHRAWIRETWMTLPNVVSRTTLSFFVVRHRVNRARCWRPDPNPSPSPSPLALTCRAITLTQTLTPTPNPDPDIYGSWGYSARTAPRTMRRRDGCCTRRAICACACTCMW